MVGNTKPSKLEILEDIAQHLKELIDSDLTSVDEAQILDKDLENITKLITDIKVKAEPDEAIE